MHIPAVILLTAGILLAGCGVREPSPVVEAARVCAAADSAAQHEPRSASLIRALEQRLREDPTSPTLLTRLGGLYAARARAGGSDADYPRAEAAYRMALRQVPRHNDATASALAAVLASQHRFAAALALADSLCAVDSANVDARAVRGDALLEMGDLEGARLSYNMLARADVGPAATTRLAHLAELTGDTTHAQAWMRSVLPSYDEDGGEPAAWARQQLALMRLKAGDDAGARMWSRAALRAQPGSARAIETLARTFETPAARVRWGATADTAAARLLDAALARLPIPELLERRAAIFTREGHAHEAAALRRYALTLYEASEATGSVGHVREHAVWLLEHGGDPHRALALAQQDSVLRGGAYVDDTLARAWWASGFRQEALEHAQRAVAHLPWDPQLLERAAHIIGQASSPAEAESLRRRAAARWSGTS